MRPSIRPSWYVVQTHPHSEVKAVQHLQRQGFETYLPRYLKRRRHARRVETVGAPLFPSYLFVAIDPAIQRWRSIRSTMGVVRLVCHGEIPTVLPDSVVDEIKAREETNGFVRLQAREPFRRGERVRILDGAFAERLGHFDGMSDANRVAILLDLLGRQIRLVMNADAVAAT